MPGSLFVDFFVRLLYLSSAQSSFSSSSEPTFSPSAQRYRAAAVASRQDVMHAST
jgi:hypothetical protein